MNRTEMLRRLSTIDEAMLRKAHRAVLDGACVVDLMDSLSMEMKQASAVLEWTERYGRISPIQRQIKREVAA